MYFQHTPEIWRDYPELHAVALVVDDVTPEAAARATVERFTAVAADRLATAAESQLAEIQAWRRAFAAMGLRPTQYRCAAESLLRRLRRHGELPHLHPLVDVCNAVSAAFAVPVAVLDTARIAESLEVRYAAGDERYETFAGAVEHPDAGEVTFVDAAGHCHARRWTNRQSGHSAVRAATGRALVVAEALHPTAGADLQRLGEALGEALDSHFTVAVKPVLLQATAPRLVF